MNSSSIGALRRPNPWVALALIVAAQFMVVLDISIVNVALATIKSDLGFSEASLQWVISAYAIVFGGFLLLGGRLADILGRRRVFVAGIALFTVASALSGLAWSAGSLVAFRGLQGLGGALFAPAGLSLLMTTFREGRERNLALGIWGAASGSGAAVGVLLGGVLTSYLDWPWVFYINVPVGLALVFLVPRRLAESRAEGVGRHFDVAGATTITASLMLLVYALTRATQNGWGSISTVTLIAASVALGVAFVAIERRAESPLLPFEVFRGTTLGTANVITAIIASIAFSQFFLLTLYLQQVLHYSAARSGLAFTAIAGTVAVTSNVAQRFVTRFGPRRVLAVGLLCAAASEALLTRLPVDGHYVTDLLPAFILIGLGIGISFVAVTIAALAGVPPRDAGIASGLVNTSRQVGGAIGLAAVTTIATTFATHRSVGESAAAATTHGYRVAFGLLAVLALVAALLTATMRVAHRRENVNVQAESPANAELVPIEEAA
jgi:EmrB/QacA subfamily drug resistance transporter